MRIIDTSEIKNRVKELLTTANYAIGEDVMKVLQQARQSESKPIAKYVLGQIIENNHIALDEQVPMCQDTGMAVVFIRMGQSIFLQGMPLEEAVNQGVREAYEENFYRKSVVMDPLFNRINTNDNTPAIIHLSITSGDKMEIIVAPKGFGSENMSAIAMLKPADGLEGVKSFILETVKKAGPNPCPPIVVGVGIGGTFEKAALMSKEALTRDLNQVSSKKEYAQLEKELHQEINQLNIGPGGFGGKTTCIKVSIEYYPTHIAGLPVAVNICCHAYRHRKTVI